MTTIPANLGRAIGGLGREKSCRTRRTWEASVITSLALCGAFTLLTTAAIIIVLFSEARRFFLLPEVSVWEFLTGLEWNPLLGAEKHFGIWPLICGTSLVTAVAMVVALPSGLITAIFLSEYAPRRLRATLKPVLEVLAGIPTVVYGFFALTVITPGLRWIHDGFEVYNVLGAGIAVGIMCMPIVCSLSEDALQAVPRALREGAHAVGGTKFDVSVKVVMPAALSGIVAAFLLAIARAVGETMIVALAAGNMARMTIDPRESAQTMTAYMVQIFLGDASNFGSEYLSSYAVAAMLFLMTFGLTIIGHRVRVRFREAYE
jgi:phosphate transport system permease protein